MQPIWTMPMVPKNRAHLIVYATTNFKLIVELYNSENIFLLISEVKFFATHYNLSDDIFGHFFVFNLIYWFSTWYGPISLSDTLSDVKKCIESDSGAKNSHRTFYYGSTVQY